KCPLHVVMRCPPRALMSYEFGGVGRPRPHHLPPSIATVAGAVISPVIVVVIVTIVIAIGVVTARTDPRIDEQSEKLSAFDQLGGAAQLGRLHGEPEPAPLQDAATVASH